MERTILEISLQFGQKDEEQLSRTTTDGTPFPYNRKAPTCWRDDHVPSAPKKLFILIYLFMFFILRSFVLVCR